MILNNFLEIFKTDRNKINQTLSTALKTGGNYSDVYFQQRIAHFIGLEDGEVNRAYSNNDLGAGIRVVNKDQTGYSFTENLSPQALLKTARTAKEIANNLKEHKPVETRLHKTPDYYPVREPWESIKIEKKISLLQELNEKIFALDKRIIKATLWFSDAVTHILIASSDGRLCFDEQPSALISAAIIAEQKGKREQNYYSIAGRNDINMFSGKTIQNVADTVVNRTVSLFEAVVPRGGEMELVLGAGNSGILLHEAIGHGMEADFNKKGTSIFSDKLNKSVAQDFVSIIDDGTIPFSRGSINIDDENIDTQKTCLVENGILRSYLHDRISAEHYKVKPTGNGRRESFRHHPMPRMRTTYMLPGPHKKEEIIKSIKKGIYAETFSNGQVLIGAGDFTFYIKTGFIIENGRLTRPIKDINVIGNGPDILGKIVMVADDLEISEGGWTCGKEGQGVPVSLGLPTVKISRITVGGN